VDLASEIHDLEESRYRGEERGNHPVTNVSWRDCEVLLKRLNEAEALWEVPAQVELSSVPQLCFPTEAQWEFACRAGTDTDFYSGDGEAALQRVGWHGQNYKTAYTHSVGMFEENAYGLKDMHGNVWEWCSDKWGNE
ncbi:MAG: formylglycine-generating enzyme family protein, partial [Cyanobacteria bacterium P01_A01_bin.17]